MGNIFTDLFSSDAAEQAAKDKEAAVNAGITQANTALDTGQAGADKLYGQALVPFTSLATKFGAGQDAYNDATGVNGAAGLARARSTFTSLPGYQEGIDMALNENDRRAAARGMLAGGNTVADTTKLATDYASQHYNDYLSSLAPNLSGATTAASGQAGVLTGQAGADLGVAGTKANIAYSGNNAIGDAKAQADMAPYQASQNFWGALLGGANAVAKAYGGGK
jgi:hypothetical protein